MRRTWGYKEKLQGFPVGEFFSSVEVTGVIKKCKDRKGYKEQQG